LEELYREFFDLGIIWDALPQLIDGFILVLELLVLSLVFAFIVGLFVSLLRLSRFRLLRWIAGSYVDFFRSMPLLMVLVYIYYGLATVGANVGWRFLILDRLPAAVLGLTLTYGAYSAEIFRAGIQSVPHGQMEAARSLGMTYPQAMRHVVLPQTFKLVIPPLTNELIAMIKDTALASVITLPELLFTAREITGRIANSSPLAAASVVYLVFTLPLIRLASRLERRYGKGARPVGM
jgi:polar amino acid transport system permease protein